MENPSVAHPEPAARFAAVRASTLALCEPLSAEDMALQSMPDASPVKWHLAHTSWFFETFVLAGSSDCYRPFHPRFEQLFNSYYRAVGEPFSRPRRGLLSRPSLNEVILLERNPMRAAKRDAMTSRRRTRVLHAGQAGDLFARWMAAAAIGFLLLFSLWMSIGVLRMMLLSELAWSDGMFTFDFQLTLWIVVSYFTVVRFLSYVDLRIRREGWEVELAMRAEEARLKGQLT